MKTRLAGLVLSLGILSGIAVPAISASASTPPPTTNTQFEADNGTSWKLASDQGILKFTGSDPSGYADAGETVNLGPAKNFTVVHPTGSANLQQNVWITDSPEATATGTHLSSAPVTFSYGLGQPGGTFYFVSGPHAGQTLTAAQIRADFPTSYARLWVGISTSTGHSTTGYVDNVRGGYGTDSPAYFTITFAKGQVTDLVY